MYLYVYVCIYTINLIQNILQISKSKTNKIDYIKRPQISLLKKNLIDQLLRDASICNTLEAQAS